jgi:ABC-type phosphate transport system substrate-binding protein
MKTFVSSFLLAASLSTIAVTAYSAEIVVIVSAKSSAATMKAEDVAQFFLGKSTQMTPIEHPDGSGIRNDFDQKVLGKDSAQVKSTWTRLVFTGKGAMPQELATSEDVKKAVAGNPNAIGYVEKSAVDSSVKVVFTAP